MVLSNTLLLFPGVLGLEQCSQEKFINYFLIINGVLSVFIFPITVMEWGNRVGGCENEHEKLGNGIYFVLILVGRLGAAICGSLICLIVYPPRKTKFIWVYRNHHVRPSVCPYFS